MQAIHNANRVPRVVSCLPVTRYTWNPSPGGTFHGSFFLTHHGLLDVHDLSIDSRGHSEIQVLVDEAN